MRPGTPPAGTVHGHFSTSISPNGWPLGNGVGDLTPEAMEGGSVLNPAMGSVWGHPAHVVTIPITAGTAPSSRLHEDCGTLKGEPESRSGDPSGHSPAHPPANPLRSSPGGEVGRPPLPQRPVSARIPASRARGEGVGVVLRPHAGGGAGQGDRLSCAEDQQGWRSDPIGGTMPRHAFFATLRYRFPMVPFR
jgi:hypothetical protein